MLKTSNINKISKFLIISLFLISQMLNNNILLTIIRNIHTKIKYFIKFIFIFLLNIKKSKKYINTTNYNKSDYKIKIAIYSHSLSNGGIERNTALLLKYLSKFKIFELYLFNKKKTPNEYKIPINVKRIIINYEKKFLKRILFKNKIDIFIYQLYDVEMLEMLKKLKKIKIIIYIHSCFLYWVYMNDNYILNNIYNEYKSFKYVISLIPFENDYLFKKWGINSIYMDNFLTYEYEKVIPSYLSSNKILMLGRAEDKNKRFDLGIRAMKYIIKEIPKSQMIIISDDKEIDSLKKIIKLLSLEDNIKFVGYTSTPEIYFKDASIHIFPSIAEAFPMVLSETKIYGIPNILLGIDYVSTSKGGVIMIYDENPKTIANISIQILKNDTFRKKLGRDARKSMQKYNNEILYKKWVKLILEIDNGDDFYNLLINNSKVINENESIYILNNQAKLLQKRIPNLFNITINDILNFSFLNYI